MNELKEKARAYLKALEAPASIGEINAAPEFSGVPRRTLSRALQELGDEGAAFRSLRGGRAYYSADPALGSGPNPARRAALEEKRGAAAPAAEAEEEPSDPLKKLSKMLGKLQDSMGGIAPEVEPGAFCLTYAEGRVADCGDYTVAVPDGFRLEMGGKDRDFTAWQPDEVAPDDSEGGRITLSAGKIQPLPPALRDPEIMLAVIEQNGWKTRGQMESVFGAVGLERVRARRVSGIYMLQGGSVGAGYQILLALPGGIKQLRVKVQSLPDNMRREGDAMVRAWLDTLTPKSEFERLPGLDDPRFTAAALTAELAKAWDDCAQAHIERINTLQNALNSAAVEEAQYRQARGGFSMETLRRAILGSLQRTADGLDGLLEQARRALEALSASEPENPALLEVYDCAVGLLANERLSVELGGECLAVSPRLIAGSAAAFRTPAVEKLLAAR